jgi:hypothetical protein
MREHFKNRKIAFYWTIRASPDIPAKKTITCAEIIIALKMNGDIRKDELRKVNHCLRLWAGENSKLADADADQDSEQSNELSYRSDD